MQFSLEISKESNTCHIAAHDINYNEYVKNNDIKSLIKILKSKCVTFLRDNLLKNDGFHDSHFSNKYISLRYRCHCIGRKYSTAKYMIADKKIIFCIHCLNK